MKCHSGMSVAIDMQVAPVAVNDRMLLNLSGLDFPFFTRNAVILNHSGGYTGDGERTRRKLEDAKSLILDRPVGPYHDILNSIPGSFV